MSIEQRAGRIYVDYNQNLAARNTIAPYSMRGRERPAVATPVTWEELGSVRGPMIFSSLRMRSSRVSPTMETWPATCSLRTPTIARGGLNMPLPCCVAALNSDLTGSTR